MIVFNIMNNLINKIKYLLGEDQNQIRIFKEGGISQTEYGKSSEKISREFLELINKYGFPYKNVAPEDIYRGGVTLSLHLDLDNMKKIFDSYLKSASEEELDNDHKAIFTDKIRVLSGLPQLYGTQFKVRENKEIELLPVEDEDNLEKRRQEAGLKPLHEYLRLLKS